MNIGTLSILLAATIFGTGGFFVKTLSLPVPTIVAFRLMVPALILLVASRDLRNRLFSNPSKTLMVASSVTALRILFWVLSLRYSSMSKSVFILYTWPIIFTILNARFLGEHVSGKSKILLATASIGILMIYSGEDLNLRNSEMIGLAFMLIVAVLNASVLTVFKRELSRHSPLEVLMYDNLVGGVLFLPFTLYNYDIFSLSDVMRGGVYGIVIGIIAYGLLYFGLSRVKAVVASILCYMEVISATLIGVLVFGEELTWRVALGGALILTAATFALKSRKEAR